MSPLVRAHYPLQAVDQSILGLPGNATEGNAPVYSNWQTAPFGGPLADTAASLVTQVMTVVPCPVDVGTVVTNISTLVGNTPGGSWTNSWAALYQGTNVTAPALISQTPDGGGTPAAAVASTRLDFSYPTGYGQVITVAMAPYGFVYVALMVKGTVCSLETVSTPAVSQYRYFPNAPLYLCQGSGPSLTTTAPATLVNASTKTTAPQVFLW
jgi:hypothetical protein